MSYQPQFRFEQRSRTGGVIFDGRDPIAEIKDLRLHNVVLSSSFPRKSETRRSQAKPGRESRGGGGQTEAKPQRLTIISEVYPLSLFWQQYANHQHPERNAGSHGRLECVTNTDWKISLQIESASHSREVLSRYLLDITYSDQLGSYVFDFRCRLTVPDGKRWLVTHNPSHGELEFCNFWPEDVFVAGYHGPSSPPESSSKPGPSSSPLSSFPRKSETRRSAPEPDEVGGRRAKTGRQSKMQDHTKRYQACYVQAGDRTERIPHHHLETSDKHDIGMGPGDRFLYLLEDVNPVIEICSSEPVAAGLCAYMWDAHFAYRFCVDGKDVQLPPGSSFDAHFKLYAIGRREGEEVVSDATPRPVPVLDAIPIYVDGLNTFSITVIPAEAAPHDLWPWEHAPEIPGVIEYALDRTEGHGDNASVRIHASQPATGRWLATTLGPAFGEPPFEPGKRYGLSAYLKTRDLAGTARIGLRLHRTDVGDVFDIANYETYYGDDVATGTTDWTAIEVTTPVIDPAPDRMHLLLEMDGVGTCWFDDVLFERDV